MSSDVILGKHCFADFNIREFQTRQFLPFSSFLFLNLSNLNGCFRISRNRYESAGDTLVNPKRSLHPSNHKHRCLNKVVLDAAQQVGHLEFASTGPLANQDHFAAYHWVTWTLERASPPDDYFFDPLAQRQDRVLEDRNHAVVNLLPSYQRQNSLRRAFLCVPPHEPLNSICHLIQNLRRIFDRNKINQRLVQKHWIRLYQRHSVNTRLSEGY